MNEKINQGEIDDGKFQVESSFYIILAEARNLKKFFKKKTLANNWVISGGFFFETQ